MKNNFLLKDIIKYVSVYLIIFCGAFLWHSYVNLEIDYIIFFFLPSIFLVVKYSEKSLYICLLLSIILSYLFSVFILKEIVDYNFFTVLFFYVVILFIVSDISKTHLKKIQELQKKVSGQTETIDDIITDYMSLNASFENMVKDMYMFKAKVDIVQSDFKNLKLCDVEDFFINTLKFLKRHNNVSDATIFTFEEGSFVYQTSIGNETMSDVFQSLMKGVEDFELVKYALKYKKTAIIKEISAYIESDESLKEEPKIVCPLIHNNEIVGIILIFYMPLYYFTEYNISLLATSANIISELLFKKYFKNYNIILDEHGMYSYEEFMRALKNYNNNVMRYSLFCYSFVLIEIEGIAVGDDIVTFLKNRIYLTDVMCRLNKNTFVICISLMDSISLGVFLNNIKKVLSGLIIVDVLNTQGIFVDNEENIEKVKRLLEEKL